MRLLPTLEHKRVMDVIYRFAYGRGGHYVAKIHDSLMVLPATHILTQYAGREPQTINYVKRHLRHGDICIDVGANIGLYTMLFAREAACVYAFEPNPAIRRVCRKAITLNDFQNVVLDGRAVSDKCGQARFYVNRYHDLSSLVPRRYTTKIMNVEKVRLDDIGLDRVDWLKIDAEGHEMAVLRGAQQLIARNPQIRLIVEFIPERGDFDEDEFFRLLEGFEFEMMDYNMVCWRAER